MSAALLERPTEVAARSTRHKWRWVLWVLLFAFVYYAINLVLVIRAGRVDDRQPTEAIVVLGAAQYNGRPSNQLAARLDHALTLYEEGVAPVVMVTGGNQEGDVYTEAETGRNYLIDAGVPAEVIVGEDQGTNTYNSLDHAAELLSDLQIERVVLVTDPYHAERTKLIANEVGLEPELSSTPSSVLSAGTQFRRSLIEAGGVGLGRIIGFDRLSGLTG